MFSYYHYLNHAHSQKIDNLNRLQKVYYRFHLICLGSLLTLDEVLVKSSLLYISIALVIC